MAPAVAGGVIAYEDLFEVLDQQALRGAANAAVGPQHGEVFLDQRELGLFEGHIEAKHLQPVFRRLQRISVRARPAKFDIGHGPQPLVRASGIDRDSPHGQRRKTSSEGTIPCSELRCPSATAASRYRVTRSTVWA